MMSRRLLVWVGDRAAGKALGDALVEVFDVVMAREHDDDSRVTREEFAGWSRDARWWWLTERVGTESAILELRKLANMPGDEPLVDATAWLRSALLVNACWRCDLARVAERVREQRPYRHTLDGGSARAPPKAGEVIDLLSVHVDGAAVADDDRRARVERAAGEVGRMVPRAAALLLVGLEDDDELRLAVALRTAMAEGAEVYWLAEPDARAKFYEDRFKLRVVAVPREEQPRFVEKLGRVAANAIFIATIDPFGEALDHEYEGRHREAEAAFKGEDYETALRKWQECLDAVDTPLRTTPDAQTLLRWRRRWLLNIATCELNLQHGERAREIAASFSDDVDVPAMSPRQRANLAVVLALLGEVSRAERVVDVPEDPSRNEDDRWRIEYARARIALARGDEPPDTPPDEPSLVLATAQAWLHRGDAARAVVHGLAALRVASGRDGLATLAGAILSDALAQTLWDAPGVTAAVPVEAREEVVRAMEATLTLERVEHLPLGLRELGLRSAMQFAAISEDRVAVERVGEKLREFGISFDDPTQGDGVVARAFEFASEGRIDEAIAVADTLAGAPWVRSSLKADVLAATERFDDALQLALRLAEEHPGRAPLEFRAAGFLLRGERATEALAHARTAFERMPGVGYRKLYARVLHQNKAYAEAWDVLRPLLDRGDEEVERLAIFLASQTEPTQELARLRKYIEQHPRAWPFRVQRAGALYRTGDLPGAAAEARAILDEAGGELALDNLRVCVGLSQVGGPPLDEATLACLRRVDMTLREHFHGDTRAEALRLELRLALGAAAPDSPIDMALVASTGRTQSFRIDEMAEVLRARRAFGDACAEFYRQGDLSFEAFCQLAGDEPARVVERIASLAGKRVAALVTPVTALSTRPVETLQSARVLLGMLEILLLQKLGLLAAFLAWTREGGGGVVLFRDVYDDLLQSVPRLAAGEPHGERERLDALRTLTREGWFNVPRERPAQPDEAWAKAHGLTFVSETGALPWNMEGLLATLRARNRLDHATVSKIAAHLSIELGEAWGTPLPPLAFDMNVLDVLHRHGDSAAIEAVRALVGEVTIGPMGWAWFEQRWRSAHESEAATSLAREALTAIGAGVRENLIELWPEERPRADDLWLPLPDAPDRATREALRTAYSLGLSYRLALHEDRTLTLVTADFVTAASLVDRWRMLKETGPLDPSRSGWLQERLPHPEPRLFSFDRLLDVLTPEVMRRQELRVELARMGALTSLDASAVRKLARRWGGLQEGQPAEVLSQMESAAKHLEHLGVMFARQHLADVYAEAIWTGHAERMEGDVAPDALLRDLLQRSEDLDRALPLRSLDLVFMYLAAKTFDRPSDVFESADGETWTLTANTPGVRLWKAAAEWCVASHPRTVALGRGVRELLILHTRRSQGLRGAHNGAIGAIVLETLRAGESLEDRMLHPALSAVAILSAVWKERPLEGLFSAVHARDGTELRLVLEDVLRSAAEWLGTEEGTLGDGATVHFRYPIDKDGGVVLLLPVDAVLLRAETAELAAGAGALAVARTPHDGEGARLLRQLAGAPDDATLRRDHAVHTTVAPWRLVREDPAVILAWWSLHRATLSGLHALDDLRAMLSEPDTLAGHVSVQDLLAVRLRDGGAWHATGAPQRLMSQALHLPGELAFEARLFGFFPADEPGRMAQIEASLGALERADDLAVGELVTHLHLLAVAAQRYRYVKVRDRQDVDLHARFVSATVGLLDALLRPPREGSLAWAEDAVLRLCGRVVGDLARPGVLPLADGIWLTWRLYQWWCEQLAFVHPEVREDALRAIMKHAPPLRADVLSNHHTLFDPFTSGRARCDRRLAAVLFALSSLEDAVRALPEALLPKGDVAPFDLSSPDLEERLLDVAQRPLTDFEETLRAPSPLQKMFGWPTSAAVPDLAFSTLLRLDGAAFARLPADVRARWIHALVPPPGRPRLDEVLAGRLFLSLVATLDALTPGERATFGAFLRELDPSSERDAVWRWLGYTALFDAGEVGFEPDAEALLERHIAQRHDMAPDLLGLYLIASAKHAPDRWVANARRLLAIASDPVPFAQAVGRVVASGPRDQLAVAQSFLRELAGEEPYRHDDRYRATLRTLGLDQPEGE